MIKVASLPIVPAPAVAEIGIGKFTLRPTTSIRLMGATGGLGQRIRELFGPATGFNLRESDVAKSDQISVEVAARNDIPSEGYRMRVAPTGVAIQASSQAGAFYAIQSLRQLLPTAIFAKNRVSGQGWTAQACSIEDFPRYSWRGLHLDVSRHFYPVGFVKEYIDWLATHKQNVFHWHLVDDGGWRIEIKKYPRLTQVGAWRKVTASEWDWANNEFLGKDSGQSVYGGFYSQAEVREVVKYAADRYITVVPEIEMPGHSAEVTAAYPNLSCAVTSSAMGEYLKGMKITQPSMVCAGKESVRAFFQDVLTEVLALFPSKFIHIGADEVDKTLWRQCPDCQDRMKKDNLAGPEELQSDFVQGMERWLSSHGRRLVGWDEILEGGLAQGATVMSWRGISGGIAAAKAGHDVIMSPTSHCYFDFSYESISTEKAYAFDPTPPELSTQERRFVLGGQANVWTEWLSSEEEVEGMVFPRACALFEALWSPLDRKDFTDFSERMMVHYKRLDQLGIAYHLEPPIAVQDIVPFKSGATVEFQSSPSPGAIIRYAVGGKAPNKSSPAYSGPIRVTRPTVVRAAAFGRAGAISPIVTVSVLDLRPRQFEKMAPGLRLRTIKGSFTQLPDPVEFASSPVSVVPQPGLVGLEGTDRFALLFDGVLRIETPGTYTIWLSSDDGSKVWLNDLLAIDHDGLHGATSKRIRVQLEAGDYAIRLGMFEQGGAESLDVDIEGPTMARQRLPASMLFHVP